MFKPPKGTRDSTPRDEFVRQRIISTIENVFLVCDAQRMDTPVFEITSILTKKYGDESTKQIYNIKSEKEDGEECALRYDLTVPWSRYVKTNGIAKMRRYQIGKVYRR